jgi:hypothetical protein
MTEVFRNDRPYKRSGEAHHGGETVDLKIDLARLTERCRMSVMAHGHVEVPRRQSYSDGLVRVDDHGAHRESRTAYDTYILLFTNFL